MVADPKLLLLYHALHLRTQKARGSQSPLRTMLSLLLLSLLVVPSRGQNMAFPPVALWVTVGLAVCLLALLIALAAVCRRKIKESCEEARREAEESKELEEEGSKTDGLLIDLLPLPPSPPQ
ncbi:unnamed protein product, partial [Boreogadus saida]